MNGELEKISNCKRSPSFARNISYFGNCIAHLFRSTKSDNFTIYNALSEHLYSRVDYKWTCQPVIGWDENNNPFVANCRHTETDSINSINFSVSGSFHRLIPKIVRGAEINGCLRLTHGQINAWIFAEKATVPLTEHREEMETFFPVNDQMRLWFFIAFVSSSLTQILPLINDYASPDQIKRIHFPHGTSWIDEANCECDAFKLKKGSTTSDHRTCAIVFKRRKRKICIIFRIFVALFLPLSLSLACRWLRPKWWLKSIGLIDFLLESWNGCVTPEGE